MPSKSAAALLKLLLASARAAASTVGSFANTVLISPLTFSSSMLAIETAPTLQPARVHGTHGAGAFFPSGVIMKNDGSVFAFTMSVQYWNDAAKPSKEGPPGGVNHPKLFAT